MKHELESRDTQLKELKAGMEEQLQVSARLGRELAQLRDSSSSPKPSRATEVDPGHDADGSGDSPAASEVERPITAASIEVEKEGFLFSADKCSRLGSLVTCGIRLENLGLASRALTVWTHLFNPMASATGEKKRQAYGTALDESGKEYLPRGNHDFKTSSALSRSLPPDVPVRVELTYEDVPTKVDALTVVLGFLGCTVEERERELFQVVLRDIPVKS